VDGGARARVLAAALADCTVDERLRCEFDLVITSVLLDAGAGAEWKYKAQSGPSYTRSEGLAVASFDAFLSGAFSVNRTFPWAADAARLANISVADVEAAFQVGPGNPLVGAEGRAALLRRLGEVVVASPAWFPGQSARPGNLGTRLKAQGGAVFAPDVLRAVLQALTPIWPSRQTLDGQALGDVWQHPAAGWVPFHKLSQWLSYSLCETLERSGSVLLGVEQLTGLAEYRNGGLFLDAGVILPRQPELLAAEHTVASQVVVEWRALTVVLLDQVADLVRKQVGLTAERLPLARVLEGGTWALGRKLAFSKRKDGASPLRIISDGTVF
jgi:Protein of unknown function (DUF1688)